ncbi:MAG: hypothetical protein MUC62_01320 [Candidatus Thermoplasmatota archaeon]|jgi:UTP-glucose-1-phosphate uridylyltransferase|nr:hypothetical protein [Candidatus Thermoplasmatota archaeon]
MSAKYIETKGLCNLVVKGLRVDIGSVEDWLKANIQVALLDPELKKKVRDYIDSLMTEGKL